MQDVCVEKVNDDLVVLVSEFPLRSGEQLSLELPRALGMRTHVQVDVISCSSVWVGDVRRQRILVRSTMPLDGRAPNTARPETKYLAPQATLPALGVLVRRVPVRVRDVSTAGCLLESLDAIAEGAVGSLEVELDGDTHVEPLRVCRSTRAPGSPWPWRAGAHFLGLHAPASASVRNLVARFEILDELSSRSLSRRGA